MAGNLPQWEIVAQKVGMRQQNIDDIINNHRSDADRRCAFLRKWIADKGNAATYRALDDVLRELGEHGAAEKICNIAVGAQHDGSVYTCHVCSIILKFNHIKCSICRHQLSKI